MAEEKQSATHDALVHEVCDRIRFAGEGVECKKCPATVEVPHHGEGTPGCYLVAEETIKLVRSATQSATVDTTFQKLHAQAEADVMRWSKRALDAEAKLAQSVSEPITLLREAVSFIAGVNHEKAIDLERRIVAFLNTADSHGEKP